MKKCIHCGAESGDQAEVCYACGEPLQAVLAAQPTELQDYFPLAVIMQFFGGSIISQLALVFCALSRSKLKIGQIELAQHYARMARNLSIAALVIGVIIVVFFFIYIAMIPVIFTNLVNNINS